MIVSDDGHIDDQISQENINTCYKKKKEKINTK